MHDLAVTAIAALIVFPLMAGAYWILLKAVQHFSAPKEDSDGPTT